MTNTETTRTLGRFVEKIEAADAIGHLNLTLVPLGGGERHGRLDYLLAAEAIEAGTLSVTEVDESGSVPELLAVNSGEKMILLLDGEELVGAKQNRIINTTILLRAKSKTKIPVSCVEQGRWHHASREFTSGNYSPANLRARKSRDVTANLRRSGRAESDQGAVWEEVECCLEIAAVESPTMAMRDVVEQRRESFDAYVDALPYPNNARGVIAAVNGAFIAADIFDNPQTLRGIWPRLITGYAMDAISRREDKSSPFTAKAAEVLLEHTGEIECSALASVGLGKDWRFEAADIIGQALIAKRTCIHLSIFPNDSETNSQPQNTCATRIHPPSRRRRNRNRPENPPSDAGMQ